jgi:hypothetical protein
MPKRPTSQLATGSNLSTDHQLVIEGTVGADLSGATVEVRERCKTIVSDDKSSMTVNVPSGFSNPVEITFTTEDGKRYPGKYLSSNDEVLISDSRFIGATALITISPVEIEYGKEVKHGVKKETEIAIITVTLPDYTPTDLVEITLVKPRRDGGAPDRDTFSRDYSRETRHVGKPETTASHGA